MPRPPPRATESAAAPARAGDSRPGPGAPPNFAHSLRNPLSYVISNLDYALEHLASADGIDADEVRAALEEARAGAARMAELLRDPMATSRTTGR